MDVSHAPTIGQSIVLGLVQGLTEFLPISSSGHLILVPTALGWAHMGKAFDVALHVGTLAAIIGYFREDLSGLVVGLREVLQGKPWQAELHRRMVVWLVLATIPAGLVGLLLHDFIDEKFGGTLSVACFVGIFGLILGLSERVGANKYELSALKARHVLLIGCAQVLALMPGVSRSGSTMTAGLLLGLTRADAARFSFLMALPITGAACLLEGVKMFKAMSQTHDYSALGPCAVGIVVSGISGWLCIHYLLKYLRTQSFVPFVVYRVMVSLFFLVWFWSHS